MITTIEGIEFEELNHEIIKKTSPKLSVWCIAYNVKDYIRDCIEGILSQVVDFQIEIVIYDDASTDGTTDIIREYCKKYPDIIHAFIAKENTYRNPNNVKIRTYVKSMYLRGEYAAICECDDYWCDRHKLQMQVDFLENNKDFVLTMHNAKRINYQTNMEDLVNKDDVSHEILPKDIVIQKNGDWPTASMVGKKEVWLCEPFFFECGVGDWPMQLYAAANGRIYYFENVMSVYRYMHKGSWNVRVKHNVDGLLLLSVKMLYFMKQYDKYTGYKYTYEIKIREKGFYDYFAQNYEISVHDLNLKCEKINSETNGKYETILKKFINFYSYIYDINYISEEIKEFVLKHKHLFIYGAGNFGGKMANALTVNNIRFEGFVVSDDREEEDFYLGKRVWKVSDIPYTGEEYGVIVAIDLAYERKWEELKTYIEKKGVKHYIYPYVLY